MTETFPFNADIQQLMSLIINTFYSNKDVFLRELISNASDALDKLRFKSVTDPSQLETCKDLQIELITDKEKKQLIVRDTGIGMTRDELITNLGTIAKSGTRAFIEAVQQLGGGQNQIGQFGVGFYASYLVADRVEVISKSNDDEKQYKWESDANGTFTVQEDTGEPLGRGTKLVLHLKEDQTDYLEESTLRKLVKKHSEFVQFPVLMLSTKTEKKEKGEDGEEGEEVTTSEMVQLNRTKPIWVESPESLTADQYSQFYKSITYEWEDYLAYKHFKVEGQVEFTALLFVPKRPSQDLFQHNKDPKNMKLYVKRVFITDECKQLLPDWLNFMTGIVDSQDLALNISREMLQQSSVLKVIKKQLIKKCMDMFYELKQDPALYAKFYEQYHKNLKLGTHEDSRNKDKLVDLLLFNSSKSEEMVFLADYVQRMLPDQKEIYYVTGESLSQAKQSPFIEKLTSAGLEVLYMCDAIDEYMMQSISEYKEFKFKCCSKENLELEQLSEEVKKEYEPLCETVKSILGQEVEKVTVGTRLQDSPCVLVTQENGWTSNMQRIMKAQAFESGLSKLMTSKKILELNPNNKIIQHLKQKHSQCQVDDDVKDLVWTVYETSLLTSGFSIENPSQFAKRVRKLVEHRMEAN